MNVEQMTTIQGTQIDRLEKAVDKLQEMPLVIQQNTTTLNNLKTTLETFVAGQKEQGIRIGTLETQQAVILHAVKKLQDDQEKTDERTTALEQKDAKKWDNVMTTILISAIMAVLGAAVAFFLG